MCPMVSFDLMHESEYSIFSFLAYWTRIHDDDVGLYRVDDFAQSSWAEYHIDLLTISIVHLTTEGFYVVSFEHRKFCTMDFALLYAPKWFFQLEVRTKSVNTSWRKTIVKWHRDHIMCLTNFQTNIHIHSRKRFLRSTIFIHLSNLHNIWYPENNSSP